MNSEIAVFDPLQWENVSYFQQFIVFIADLTNYLYWKYLNKEVLYDSLELLVNFFEHLPFDICLEYYRLYRKFLTQVVFTYRFWGFVLSLYYLYTIIWSWVPWIMSLKRAYLAYKNLQNHPSAREAVASLEDVENIPAFVPAPRREEEPPTRDRRGRRNARPVPTQPPPPAYDPVDWTNVERLTSTLVMECKLETVFSKYSEANKLVVERWVNKRLEVLAKRGLRLSHRKRIKDRFMVLVFLKDAFEMEMKELQDSAIIQEHLKAGMRKHQWYYVRDDSTFYLPWFRRVLEPGEA